MPDRLYLYADESGQDTKGRFFLVALMAVQPELHQRLSDDLLRIEKQTGKDKKWTKSKIRHRHAYIERIFTLPYLHGHLFVAKFEDTTQYRECMLDAIERALSVLAAKGDYRVSVFIDGLQKSTRRRISTDLRSRMRSEPIGIEKVQGRNDQNDALIRLVDSIAGLGRHASDQVTDMVALYRLALRRGIIIEI